MDEGTWSTVLGTFRKAPSLVGADVVTDFKIDYAAQGGPQAFELCAKFCYGIVVTLNTYKKQNHRMLNEDSRSLIASRSPER